MAPATSTAKIKRLAGPAIQRHVPSVAQSVEMHRNAKARAKANPALSFRPMLQTGSSWPKFRGNLLNTGRATVGGANSFNAWATATNAAVQASPVVAADGTIFVGSTDGIFYALNPDGTVKWTNTDPLNFVVSTAAIGSDGTLYFGSNDNMIYAVNSVDGTTKWTYTTGGAVTSSPTVAADGTIYVGSDDFSLYALNPDGTLKWHFDTLDKIDSSPALAADGTIYIGSYDGFLYAVNPNGTQKWSNHLGSAVSSTPAIQNDGNIVVGCTDSNIYSLSRVDGTTQWLYSTGGPVFGSAAIGTDGTVYIGSTDNNLYAINPGGGDLVWTSTFGGGVNSSPAIAGDGTIYVGSDDFNLYALSPTDGSQIWSVGTGGKVISSPAIAPDGTLYFGSFDKSIYEVGSEVNTVPASSLTIAPASVPGGNTATGTITLTGPAPFGSDIVALQSSDPAVIVPNFVVVAAGDTTANFTINTSVVNSAKSAIVTATSGSVNVTAPLTVQALVPVSLTFSPATIVGGVTTSTATLTFNGKGAPGGTHVAITNQWPTYVNTLSSVTLSSTSNVVTFTVSSPQMWQIQFTDLISATLNGVSVNATLTVATTALQSVSITPSTLAAGNSATGTLTLGGPAPAGGWVVTLISGNPAFVSIPATVTVPAGASTATFVITTAKASPTFSCLISAHDSVIWHSATINVQADSITGLSLSPSTVSAGASSTGTVTLKTPAPSAGWSVKLSSGVPGVVFVPSTLVIPAGASSGNFTVTTKPTSSTVTSGVYASDNVSGASANLTVVGNLVTNLTLNPATIGGNGTSTGTVTLASNASNGGVKINLSVGVPSVVTVPASVTVPAGANSVTFPITAKQVSASYTMGVYATDGNSTRTATLTVNGDSIASVSVNPTSVKGGNSATGTVTLTSPAPFGGWLVTLKAGASGVVTVPTTVLIPAGATQATFPITTKAVATTLTSLVYASDGNSGQGTNLTVTN